MKISTNLWTHPDDMPRNLTALGVGMATGFLGTAIPVVAVGMGVVLQLLEPSFPQLVRFQYVTEGVVDGGAALLGRMIGVALTGGKAFPQVSDDRMGLVG